MFIILLGAPGCGKGTLGTQISEGYNIPTISTGQIIRENIKNQTPLGKTAKQLIENGNLVPDDMVIQLVKDRIKESDCKNGCIMDGFPRTVFQAEKLNEFAKVDNVIFIDVAKSVIEDRILSRRTCPKCSKIFNIKTYDKNTCDSCNTPLVVRSDDTLETIQKRFEVYEQQTKPLIEFYTKQNILSSVDGNNSPEEVYKQVKLILDRGTI